MRSPRMAVVVGLTLALSLGELGVSLPPTARAQPLQRAAEEVDLSAIMLTTSDLERVGLDGYGYFGGSHIAPDAAIRKLAEDQKLDTLDIRDAFADVGFLDLYRHDQRIPADPAAPGGVPARQVETSAYLFEVPRGAETAYAFIAEEGELGGSEVLDIDVRNLGDAADLTVIRHEDTEAYGVPYTELELEILHGRLVLAVSIYTFGDDGEEAAGPPDVARDAVDTLEALAERLVERADAVLDGDSPRLGSAVVRIESDVTISPFLAYQLLDGDPVRSAFETEAVFENRVAGNRELGVADFLRHEQILAEATRTEGDVRFNTLLFSFGRLRDGRAFMDGVLDRIAGDPAVTGVEVEEGADRVGDDSLALALGMETDGEAWTRNQLMFRVGDTVAVTWLNQSGVGADVPEIPCDVLSGLGGAQAACLEADACDDVVPMPEELEEILGGLPASRSDGARASGREQVSEQPRMAPSTDRRPAPAALPPAATSTTRVCR